MHLRPLATCLILIQLTACGGGEEDSNFIPTVTVECSSADVTDCTLSARAVYVGLSDDQGVNCDTSIKGLNQTQRQQLFTVSGQATSSTSGIYLTATVSSWQNNVGGSQDSLNPGTYKVCGFIDSNGNGRLDTVEPVASGQANAGQSRFNLTAWTTAL